MKKLLSRKHGFTLLELMIVMAIIAILAVLGIAAIQAARRNARDTQRRANGKTLQVALEGYYSAQTPTKTYPANPAGNNASLLTYWGIDGVGGTADDGVLYSYISDPLIDPDGPHNLRESSTCTRYYYNRTGTDSYQLRVTMESGPNGWAQGSEGAAPVTTGEAFDIQ